MKLTKLWLVTKIIDFTYPYGIIPLVYCTYKYPLIIFLWIVLGILGFRFGLKTWKYYVSKRDKWAKSEMEMVSWRMGMAFLRLREFCYFGATIGCIVILICF